MKKKQKRIKGKAKSNRQYKDSVFVDIFSRNEETRQVAAVSLYNALHEEKIAEDAKIEFLELKNVLYHKHKNDVSFRVNDKIIVLIEHQSTINENMPFRFLLYIAALYDLIIEAEKRYRQHLFKIPKPEFYVIYNGVQEYPAISELCLSDAFEEVEGDVQLELKVKVININHEANKDFLKKCPLLEQYQEFVKIIYDYKQKYGEKGFFLGIQYCIEHGIFPEYLIKNITEVVNMLQQKYKYRDEVRVIREEERELGIKQGIKQGMIKGRLEGIQEGLLKGMLQGTYDTNVKNAKEMLNLGIPVETIMKVTGLKKDEVLNLIKK